MSRKEIENVMKNRRQSVQTVAWFNDLYKRGLLDLSPEYQRRSVWNEDYKDYFLDTILSGFPAPAIFLYEEISPEGEIRYSVVDGKQRLSTILEFVKPNSEVTLADDESRHAENAGKTFDQLSEALKVSIWTYKFSIEFLPSKSENLLKEIFDRINRNVNKLTPQELRNARYSGCFSEASEELADKIDSELKLWPRYAAQARRQMKDVEFASHLLLLVENGPSGVTQEQMDEVYASRQKTWEQKKNILDRAFLAVSNFKKVLEASDVRTEFLEKSKNQANFYSLFDVFSRMRELSDIQAEKVREKLDQFFKKVYSGTAKKGTQAAAFRAHTRASSSDSGPRSARSATLLDLLSDFIADKGE
ncbi:DUF262 domain-containing protein [Corynebacterium sp. HMSC035E02]|uniref:DUF262 domain-containing protein n=1 Tax=Corynebacterium sp. HMSC035E02 TaxID=1715114 RepID=UPI0009F4A158|nr:DUF262 domain-containing protein [Corynebacterium sp. HMSC035E02]